MESRNQKRSLRAELDIKKEFIDLKLIGELDKHRSIEICREVTANASHQKLSDVLLDIRMMEGRESYLELFQSVGKYPASLRHFRIAVLEHDQEMARGGFHENVAINRGYQIRYFTEKHKAMNWLCGN